ncbi:alanine--tRNA ligase-related protein [Peptostreptococcus faecalis]|uniref:alanine--tRNA ligase-related protein n=1 Tax=Peptostreptococcus faecalis TaxID=2045015 RepID=UPI000C79BF1B|nr:alanyl-tRNA editing protein [Peptostreptococcus faecalis]
MEELYYRERYKQSAEVIIEKIIEKDDKLGIVLNETVLFPGGGGQISDIGIMKSLKNVDYKICKVEESSDGEIVHYINERVCPVSIGESVCISLDWDRRKDSMQQHTGQHVLSGVFFKLFGRNTKSIHIGKDTSELVIEGEFTEDMVNEVERFSNDSINKELVIENFEIDTNNGSITTRRPIPKSENPIRILKIGNLDTAACCGVHLYNTKDLGLIKIKKFYKFKGDTKLEFLVGKRAVDYILSRDVIFSKVLNKFNSGESNIANSIENLEIKKDEFYYKYKYSLGKALKADSYELVENCNRNIKNNLVIKKTFLNEEQWYIDELAKYITERYDSIVIFENRAKGAAHINIQGSKVVVDENSLNIGNDFKINKHLSDLKGGGSRYMAQGVTNNIKEIDIFSDYIYSIYCGKLDIII